MGSLRFLDGGSGFWAPLERFLGHCVLDLAVISPTGSLLYGRYTLKLFGFWVDIHEGSVHTVAIYTGSRRALGGRTGHSLPWLQTRRLLGFLCFALLDSEGYPI